MDKKRVVAYCRVSTDKDDQANSFASQKAFFTEFINKNDDWQLINIYADEGISGTSTKKRIQFNQMIIDAKNNKFDLILTKEVSRFARNTIDTLQYTRMLKDLNIGVVFLSDNINTLDNDGELRLSIMATIAQEESRKTSERVKWGQKRRMEQGIVFGRDLLGYYVRNGELLINPNEVEIVKMIFNKYTNEHKGTYTIARELYRDGILSKTNKPWTNATILKILSNEKYVGDLCQKKTYTPNYLTHDKKYNYDSEEKVYLYNHHEPIIDRDLWERTQIELKKRTISQEQKSKHSNRYWCSGKIVCGECGSKFVSRTKKLKNGDTYKAWRCYQAAEHGNKKIDELGETVGCSTSSINDRTLQTCVSFACSNIVETKDEIIASLIKEIKAIQGVENNTNVIQIENKINELNGKKKKVIRLLVEDMISREDMKLMNDEYDREIEQLQNISSLSKQRIEIQQQQINDIEKYIKRIQSLTYNTSDNSTELFKEILEKIVVFNGRVLEIYFKDFPFAVKLKYISYGKNDTFTTKCTLI